MPRGARLYTISTAYACQLRTVRAPLFSRATCFWILDPGSTTVGCRRASTVGFPLSSPANIGPCARFLMGIGKRLLR